MKDKTIRVLSVSEVLENFKRVIDQTIDDADITIIHRQDGENAVLMSQCHYNSLMETLYLLSTPANAQALACAIAQDKTAQGVQRQLPHIDE